MSENALMLGLLAFGLLNAVWRAPGATFVALVLPQLALRPIVAILAWLAYVRDVRPWFPRLRPWYHPGGPPAHLFVAQSCGMCHDVGD